MLGKTTRLITKGLTHQRKQRRAPMCDFERIRYELKPCDIILVEGRSRVSEVIKLITQSPWSHAALYIGRLHDIEDPEIREQVTQHCDCSPDSQLLVESELGMGTVIRPITVYEKEHLRICRPRGLKYQDAQQIINYAISRVGVEYDVRQIFDLARFLFPWRLLPRRWRSSLFAKGAGRTTKTVCSTMIAEAFNNVQFPILPLVKTNTADGRVQLFRRNPKLCAPRDFDYSPYFKIIKYPFIDYSHHASYRLLPWHGNIPLDNEEADLYLSPGESENSLVAIADNEIALPPKKPKGNPH
ncbi:hypothetical protein [Spartinivicinus poritis]|uniref:Lipo-like protein n=1 Tax=Spartinivicinus poritis TaxID=2994640 RepID=A0ABT5UDQ8_9GAMM|nr:hypothetical protein [Spartinivicinus sp. A2-2]MDE1464516.1 hypothetical protein [Spartinivicinus sp. A2-2]